MNPFGDLPPVHRANRVDRVLVSILLAVPPLSLIDNPLVILPRRGGVALRFPRVEIFPMNRPVPEKEAVLGRRWIFFGGYRR